MKCILWNATIQWALYEREMFEEGGGRKRIRKAMLGPGKSVLRRREQQNIAKCSKAGWTQKDEASWFNEVSFCRAGGR